VNSTVDELLQHLMIEQWNVSVTYENYYQECKPAQCSYSYEARNDAIYILTTLISLVGGLSTTLKLLTPQLINFVRKKKESERPVIVLSMRERTIALWTTMKYYIHNFNVFPSIPPSTDQHQLRNQFISTRLFIFLFSSFFSILLLYNSLITIRKTVIAKSPSFADYVQLNATYSQTLTCPCTQISIDYKNIVHVNYTLHQVCSSVFITQNWIDYVYNSRKDYLSTDDFMVEAPNVFFMLDKVCEIVNLTLSNRFNVFYASPYTSGSITSYYLLQSDAQAAIEQLKLFTISNLVSSLSLIRQMIHGNSIVTGILSNYNFQINTDTNIEVGPKIYDQCDCSLSPLCTERAYIYDVQTYEILFEVPGFLFGCYIVEALLQSTLECFYDKNCTDSIQSYLSYPAPFPIANLNSSLASKYRVNSTVDELLQHLMIEQWNVSVTYENYYQECKPAQCSYSYEARNDAIYIVTTLISLTGGLVAALRTAVPLAVRLVAYCIRRRNIRVDPYTLNSEQT
ncbi:unnamed protein product, partial [Adineta ricciae]